MTWKSAAKTVAGSTGAEGLLQTSIVDISPAGAKARIGNPLPYSSL
jgi:hypothetical protein